MRSVYQILGLMYIDALQYLGFKLKCHKGVRDAVFIKGRNGQMISSPFRPGSKQGGGMMILLILVSQKLLIAQVHSHCA